MFEQIRLILIESICAYSLTCMCKKRCFVYTHTHIRSACSIELFTHSGSCHLLTEKKKRERTLAKKRRRRFFYIIVLWKKKIRMSRLRNRELPRAVKVINHHCFLAQYKQTDVHCRKLRWTRRVGRVIYQHFHVLFFFFNILSVVCYIVS